MKCCLHSPWKLKYVFLALEVFPTSYSFTDAGARRYSEMHCSQKVLTNPSFSSSIELYWALRLVRASRFLRKFWGMSFQAATGELGSPVGERMPKDEKCEGLCFTCATMCSDRYVSSRVMFWVVRVHDCVTPRERGNDGERMLLSKHSTGASMTADFRIGCWNLYHILYT